MPNGKSVKCPNCGMKMPLIKAKTGEAYTYVGTKAVGANYQQDEFKSNKRGGGSLYKEGFDNERGKSYKGESGGWTGVPFQSSIKKRGKVGKALSS